MKCISLIQPWATLILSGAKRFETRGWRTPYRGPLATHASGRFPSLPKSLCHKEPFQAALRAAGVRCWTELPLGKLLGVVTLEDRLRAFPLHFPCPDAPSARYTRPWPRIPATSRCVMTKRPSTHTRPRPVEWPWPANEESTPGAESLAHWREARKNQCRQRLNCAPNRAPFGASPRPISANEGQPPADSLCPSRESR